MNKAFFNYKFILFLAGCLILLLFFVYLGISAFSPRPKSVFIPKPTPGNFKAIYSNFNKLVPGKSTKEDVILLNGSPASEKSTGGKTYLNYPTPSSSITNVAVVQKGVLLYATEEVFDNYRGFPEDYTKQFGPPEITMYDTKDDAIEWRIFPSRGIAIAVAPFENIITKITYFIPQTKDNFIKSLSGELGLIVQKPAVPTTSTEQFKEFAPVGN